MVATKDSILQAHKENVRKNRMIKPKFWKYTTILLLILFIVMAYNGGNIPFENNANKDIVVENTVNYLNNELLSGLAVAELTEAEEDKGLYKIVLHMTYANGLEEEFESYVTKDGELLFPSFLEIGTGDNTEEVVNNTEEEVVDNVDNTEEVVNNTEEVDLCQSFCNEKGFETGTCRETTEEAICQEGETAFGFDQCDSFKRCCCQ